jgi:probable rRNA maturation factor
VEQFVKISVEKRTRQASIVSILQVKKFTVVIVNEARRRYRTFITEYHPYLESDFLYLARWDIDISFVSSARMRELNYSFRGKDKTTDVLSFSQLEGDSVPSTFYEAQNKVTVHLGDIVIDLDQAIRQAGEYHHSVSSEVARLVIHGTLHLLGFDHEQVSGKDGQRMRRIERSLWSSHHHNFQLVN